MKIKNINFIMLILAAGCLYLFSQTAEEVEKPGHMVGFVYEKDGKTPVKDAQVILRVWPEEKKNKAYKKRNDYKIYKSNITGSKGDYSLMDIPVGNYKVEILLNNKPYKISHIDFLVTIMSEKTNYVSFSLRDSKTPLAIIIMGTAVATSLGGEKFVPEPEESKTIY